MKKHRQIEKSIIKKFRKEIWSKFIKGIKEYELIDENDKIAVCLSGGKDSFLLAKLMEELKRHNQIEFNLEYIIMDPGYTKGVREQIEKNFKLMNLKAIFFNTDVFKVANKSSGKPCYLCARMRRGHLYSKAKELGCNKIALGHHFDDVIETILLNMLYAGEIKTMLPKLKSKNFAGMELIRPLYLIKEEHIEKWVKYNNLEFVDCSCSYSTSNNDSKRDEMKKLIEVLRSTNPYIDINIFRSVENVNLRTLISYKENDEVKSFSDGQ